MFSEGAPASKFDQLSDEAAETLVRNRGAQGVAELLAQRSVGKNWGVDVRWGEPVLDAAIEAVADQQGVIVANMEAFDVDPTEIGSKLLASSSSPVEVIKNIEKFPGLDHNEVAMRFVGNEHAALLVHNIAANLGKLRGLGAEVRTYIEQFGTDGEKTAAAANPQAFA